MKHDITTTIEILDKMLLDVIYNAIRIETKGSEIKRGRVEIEKNETQLIIKTFGRDLTSTRGLTNSIMRLVKTSIEVAEAIE